MLDSPGQVAMEPVACRLILDLRSSTLGRLVNQCDDGGGNGVFPHGDVW